MYKKKILLFYRFTNPTVRDFIVTSELDNFTRHRLKTNSITSNSKARRMNVYRAGYCMLPGSLHKYTSKTGGSKPCAFSILTHQSVRDHKWRLIVVTVEPT